MMKRSNPSRAGFSLLELTAVIAILGIVAAVVIPRVAGSDAAADIAGCNVYKGNVEIQAEIWNHNTGSWPAANLSDIGASLDHFPEGLPTCPVDGTSYTIDVSTGRVVGHNH